MTQDNANEPTVAEEIQTSEQNPATQVNPMSEQITADTQVAEPVTEQGDELSEEDEVETEDASPEDTAETETSSPSDPANAITTPAPASSETEKDERSEIEKQPYDCAPHHAA